MESMNYSNARAQLTMLMDKVVAGQSVEITRKSKASVVMISKATYEAYKRAEFDAKFPKDK